MSFNASNHSRIVISLIILVGFFLLILPTSYAQNPVSPPAPKDVNDPDREVLPDLVEDELLDRDQWVRQVLDLKGEIARLEKGPEDADFLFVELGPVLRERIDLLELKLDSAKSADEPITLPKELGRHLNTLQDLFESTEHLYASRVELLEFISDDLFQEVTGTKLFGAQELRTEARFALQTIRYQFYGLPAAWEFIGVRMDRSPMRFLVNLLQLILLFALFSWWRRWFPETLESMRRSLMSTRPRSPAAVSRLKAIWYLEQLRSPIEWLIVLHLAFVLVQLDPLQFGKDLLFIFVRWILVGRVIVLLINAVAARGEVGLAGKEGSLRLNSLRLVAVLLLSLGIGLALAEYLTGKGAFHAWVWRIFQVMSIPVAIVLLAWWRSRIFARLALEPDDSGRLRETLGQQKGFKGMLNAASALGYLTAGSLRRSMLKRVGAENMLSEMAQNQLADTMGDGPGNGGNPEATRKLREAFLAPSTLYAPYARPERRRLIQRINSGGSGAVVVTGLRGIGKSRFLESLEGKIEGEVLQLDCRSGKAKDFIEGLLEQMELPVGNSFPAAAVSTRLTAGGIRAITIDNAHRLIRPLVGIQQQLDIALEELRKLSFDGLWIFAVDRHTWVYALASQPTRDYVDTLIDLPPWSEEQMGEYIDKCCEELGVKPDFSEVVVPRQFLDATHSTMAERNRLGIIRMLTEYSDGNPSVALRLWGDSLTLDESGKVAGTLPALGSTVELDSLLTDGLVVLRLIALFERISLDEIKQGLRLTGSEVDAAVRTAITRGWVVQMQGGLALAWNWFPVINRVLTRHNLLPK